MDQEGKVHSLLLTVVVCDKHDWLNVLHEIAHADHASEHGVFVSVPTRLNVKLLVRVKHEMFLYHASIRQDLNVELLQENFLEQSDSLGRTKSLKVVLCGYNEG